MVRFIAFVAFLASATFSTAQAQETCNDGQDCIGRCESRAFSQAFCCSGDGPGFWGRSQDGDSIPCEAWDAWNRQARERRRAEAKGDTGPQGPQGPQGDVGPQGPAGQDGKSCTVRQIKKGTYAMRCPGQKSLIWSDGKDRPLNAEVGGIIGWRQVGATPEFNLGVDVKLIFKDLWYLKGGWQFGTAMVDDDPRQYQSVGLAALGLRFDGGVDLGIRAEYSQTGTKPFGGWRRRSWTTGLEVEVYPLVWAGVSDDWKRFLKVGAYIGLGEEFRPGSAGSDLLFSSSVYLGLNAVF